MAEDPSAREWIRREMTLEKPDMVMQVKERVAALLGVSTDGIVGFRLTSEQLKKMDAKDRILLYLIGKVYAQAAGYSADDAVSNDELARSLGMPEGTVKSQLNALRATGFVNPVKRGIHSVARNRMVEGLSLIESKVK